MFEELYEERRHLENLLNARFNFFLIIFAVILASLFSIKTINQLRIIIISGAIIETLLAIVIARAQVKLSFFLCEIRKNKNHAESKADIYANASHNPFTWGSRNKIIGYYIPLMISISLIISIFFSQYIFDKIGKGYN